MAKNSKYLNRDRCARIIRKIHEAFEAGRDVEEIEDYVARAAERVEVPWRSKEEPHNTANGLRCADDIAEIVEEEPGLTYAELEEALEGEWSRTFIKAVAQGSDRFTVKDRTDKKKFYGRYPHGVYLTDEDEES